MGIDIVYYGVNTKFSTFKDIPSINDFYSYSGDNRLGRHKNYNFKIVQRGDSYFIFLVTMGYSHYNVIFLIILLSLVISYLLIKRILRPINWLSYGVNRISRGDLSYYIPVRGRDQLGELANSFNGMTSRVREMLKLREQLLLDVSHELRSPITRVKLALEFISDSRLKDSISDDIIYLEGMVNELLEVERLRSDYGKLKLGLIDIVSFIRDILDNRARLLVNNRIYVNIDAKRIRLALNNIINNAIRHSDNKGVEVMVKEKIIL